MVDALYFSVATISTVGYGDIAPKTTLGKLFTIFYLLAGAGVFVSIAATIAFNVAPPRHGVAQPQDHVRQNDANPGE
jgi:voltage-gated potassium channel Kch